MLIRRTAIALLVATGIGVAGWLYAGQWRPSETDYPRQGIQVSRAQGSIDWPQVAAQRQVDFAYIKASEGADIRDGDFAANWKGAGEARIARGALHSFSLCRPGDAQAENFIAAVPQDEEMLAPAVELIFEGNCAERPAPESLLVELMIFLRRVEERYRQSVILQLSREFDAGYDVSARIPRRLWLRRLWREPDWGARPWMLWQASRMRSVPGIERPVAWSVARP